MANHLDSSSSSHCNDQSNRSQLCGTIAKIHLKNFKNHSLLDFELNQNINFILGRNGSGKSALMDAVILCLGGSSDTSSQAVAKSFIKNNENKALLQITLNNHGIDSFKKKSYGSHITIERSIYLTGKSSYKIFNDKNKVISIKKEDIYEIAEHFNIQVNNPICFLNQETSKTFFSSSHNSSKEIYQLFMKASQLDSMKRFQEKIKKVRQDSFDLIKSKQSFLPQMEDELFELEQNYKQFESVDKLESKMHQLLNEQIWSMITSDEQIFDQKSKEKLKLIKKKELEEKDFNSNEQILIKLNDKNIQIKDSLNDLDKKYKELKAKLEKLNHECKSSAINRRLAINDSKSLTINITKRTTELVEIKAKLNEENNRLDNETEIKQLDKTHLIKSLECKIETLEATYQLEFEANANCVQSIDETETQISNKNLQLKGFESLIKNLQKDVDKLYDSTKNQMDRFGKFMKNLVTEIDSFVQQGRFKEKPRGPIGMFIESKDDKYSLAIEQCVGGLLKAFICCNYDDEKVMQQLFKKHFKDSNRSSPPIIVTNFNLSLYDVNRFKPKNNQYPTVYDMLTIRDHIVANVLIDQRKIESILLLPDYETARNVIELNSTANCYEAFIPTGDQFLGKPSYKIYCCNRSEAVYLVKNVDEIVESKLKKINDFKQDLQTAQAVLEKMNSIVRENKIKRIQNEFNLSSIRNELNKLKIEKKAIDAILVTEPSKIKIYQNEIDRIESEIDDFNSKIQMNTNLINMKDEETVMERQNLECEIEILASNKNQLKEDLKSNNEEILSQCELTKHKKGLVQKTLQKIDQMKNEINEKKIHISASLSLTNELDRIHTIRSTESIEQEMNSINQLIEFSEKFNGNKQEITQSYLNKIKTLSKIRLDIQKQNIFLKRLQSTLDKREKRLRQFIESKAIICARNFSNILYKQNFVGHLKFNHKEQVLKIDVHSNQPTNGYCSKDLVALSGGERSYSKVAFLLSLWSIVESPVLFLDEFDVFMDEANRKAVMELLINSAKEKLTEQYVFLTPQHLMIKNDQYLKLFKMPDPKRKIEQVSVSDENDQNNNKISRYN